jgi:hypothetical protein
MPQAGESLSGLQKDAIEKSYITLGIVAVFLDSVVGKLQESDDRLLAAVNKDSAQICRRHLLTAFPKLHFLQGGA